jgi:hypothetical protein
VSDVDDALPDAKAEAVRIDYENTSIPVDDVCEKHGVPLARLYAMRDRWNWKGRQKPRAVNRTVLIGRMFGLLDNQLTLLEENMKSTGDKEVAVLGNLARTLEKLIEIQDAEKPKRSTKAHSRDMQDIRRQLEKRIDDLTKG